MGLGSAALVTNTFSDPAPQPGPPFAATSANNGLSIDPVTGKIVFGNDVGNVAAPARLLSPREIELFGSFIRLLDVNAGQNRFDLMSNSIRIDDLPSGGGANIQVGAQQTTMDLITTVPGFPAILNMVSNAGAISLNTEGNTSINFQDAVKAWSMMLLLGVLHLRDSNGAGNGLIIDATNNTVTSTGTLATANPGLGAGDWRLGTVVAGAVVPDALNYVEVMVSGVVKKFIVAV